MSPRTGISSCLRASPRQRKNNYSIICNKIPAAVSGGAQPCQLVPKAGSIPILLGLTQGCREELLLLVVSTNGVGQHLPSPTSGIFVLYHSGKHCRVKTEKKSQSYGHF